MIARGDMPSTGLDEKPTRGEWKPPRATTATEAVKAFGEDNAIEAGAFPPMGFETEAPKSVLRKSSNQDDFEFAKYQGRDVVVLSRSGGTASIKYDGVGREYYRIVRTDELRDITPV